MRSQYILPGYSLAAAAALLILSFIAPLSAFGQDRTGSNNAGAGESGATNTVGLFLGATTKFKEKSPDETSFTIAGEYEYQPAKGENKWGVGGLIELIFAHELEGIVLPVVYYHPMEDWFVRTGVGLEIGLEEDAETGSAHLLWRTGVGYIFPVGKALLVPSIDLDLVRSDRSIAYGVVIAKEF